MTKKFAIWTVQRTGSTSLANILTLLSGTVVHHEPFNNDRFLAYKGDKEALISQLKELASQQLNFKHCWNVHPNWCNDTILDFLLQENYSVILLQRKNMLKVQLSKELAKQTGIWGKQAKLEADKVTEIKAIDIPALKSAMKTYHTQLTKYQSFLQEKGYNYQELCFEDIFADTMTFDEKLASIMQICQFLDIDTNSSTEQAEKLRQQLMANKQNDTKDYQQIPNMPEIQAKFPSYQI